MQRLSAKSCLEESKSGFDGLLSFNYGFLKWAVILSLVLAFVFQIYLVFFALLTVYVILKRRAQGLLLRFPYSPVLILWVLWSFFTSAIAVYQHLALVGFIGVLVYSLIAFGGYSVFRIHRAESFSPAEFENSFLREIFKAFSLAIVVGVCLSLLRVFVLWLLTDGNSYRFVFNLAGFRIVITEFFFKDGRLSGMIDQPALFGNLLALYLVFPAYAVLSWIFSGKDNLNGSDSQATAREDRQLNFRQDVVLHVVALILGFIGIVLTGTRGALLLFVLELTVLFLILAPSFKKALAMIFVAGIILVAFSLAVPSFRIRFLHSLDPHWRSNATRLMLIKASFDILKNTHRIITGVGLLNFRPLFNLWRGWGAHASIGSSVGYGFVHNLYVHFLVEEGIVGVLVVAFLFVQGIVVNLRRVVRLKRAGLNVPAKAFSAVALAVVSSFMIHSLIDNLLFSFQSGGFIFLIMGLAETFNFDRRVNPRTAEIVFP